MSGALKKWPIEQVMRAYGAECRKNAITAAQWYLGKLRALVSTPFPPASQPGEAPHLRTGTLANLGFEAELDEDRRGIRVIIRHSERVEYGPFLEGGTEHMARRPHLYVVYASERERLKRYLAGQGRRPALGRASSTFVPAGMFLAAAEGFNAPLEISIQGFPR